MLHHFHLFFAIFLAVMQRDDIPILKLVKQLSMSTTLDFFKISVQISDVRDKAGFTTSQIWELVSFLNVKSFQLNNIKFYIILNNKSG